MTFTSNLTEVTNALIMEMSLKQEEIISFGIVIITTKIKNIESDPFLQNGIKLLIDMENALQLKTETDLFLKPNVQLIQPNNGLSMLSEMDTL